MPVPGPKCSYCGAGSALVDASAVYGPKFENRFSVWACINFPDCDSYVGVKPGLMPDPVGTLANPELRAIRRRLHDAIQKQIDALVPKKRKSNQQRLCWESRRDKIGWLDLAECQRQLRNIIGNEEYENIGRVSTENMERAKNAPIGDQD